MSQLRAVAATHPVYGGVSLFAAAGIDSGLGTLAGINEKISRATPISPPYIKEAASRLQMKQILAYAANGKVRLVVATSYLKY